MENHEATATGRFQRTQLWLLAVIAVVAVGWALHVMQAVFVPIVCSIFVTLLVHPLDTWVAGRTPDRLKWLGRVVAMAVLLLVIGLFFGGIWLAAERVEQRLPQIIPDVDDVLASQAQQFTPEQGEQPAAAPEGEAGQSDERRRGDPGAFVSEVARAVDQTRSLLGGYGLQFARTLLASTGDILGGLILIVFLTLLMLVEQPRWRSKLETLQRSATGGWLRPIRTVADKIRRYLLARAILGVLTAALYTIWLWAFDVDLLVVWALLTFVMNFIPNLGSLISGALPVLYAFLTRDLQTAIFVGAGILVIEQVIGNYIDPRMQGRQVSLSPFLVLVALLLWGWIWGIAGAVLAVPITVAALVLFAHIPALRPLALLLSRERDMEGLSDVT